MRYLKPFIEADLNEKMVFVGGPRQVGKTTLALDILNGDIEHPAYLNWDTLRSRALILKEELPANEPLILFDEIHKYLRWRNVIKGFYDTQKKRRKFLVTGSARLDLYRRGGDSLQGRYHYYRLHPYSHSEMQSGMKLKDIEVLLCFGGFPEPLSKQSDRHWKRWQLERRTRVVQDDLLPLESVKDISQMDLLMSLLPDRVGAPLSIKSLSEDLLVSFVTAERWVNILEKLYYCYRIMPYTRNLKTAMRKEKKLYMWDWSLAQREGPRFENMVAGHLLKYCHFIEDTQGDRMELRFLRDKDKREIDFIVMRNNKAEFAVECKTGERQICKHIEYFSQRTDIPRFYQTHLGIKDTENARYKTRTLPFTKLCQELGLP